MLFFCIEAEGFTFGVLGLFVAVFHQLDLCISCMLPLKGLSSIFHALKFLKLYILSILFDKELKAINPSQPKTTLSN